ncbi:MAG: hypothetical protein ABIS45_01550 [Burkholderiales bacterium]
MIEQAGFRDAKVVEIFDPFLGTSKEQTARKYGVEGVNFLAYKR